jgi:Rrf2 family protein
MTRVPSKYLSKVMQALVRADLVISKPGKSGGFSLKVPADKLSLLTVIEAIDTPMHEEPRSLELQTYGNILCPLHQRMNELIAHVRKEFNTIMIRDLLP